MRRRTPAARTLPSSWWDGRTASGCQLAVALVFFFLAEAIPAWGQNLTLQTGPGGITITGGYHSGFGAVNGLGVGVPPAGTSVITAGVSGGVLYVTPFNNIVSGVSGSLQILSSYLPTNFTHSSNLVLEICGTSGGCGSAANYTPISTNPAVGTDYSPESGVGNGTYTAYLGLFVSNADGGGAYTGSDSAVLTVGTFNVSDGHKNQTQNLTLNSPNVTVQTAVQLLLATSGGGLTISPGSDFSANFGNVNGLGIGTASAGLTVITSGVSGGAIYSTPYQITPSFSSFGSTTGTVKMQVTANFAHTNTLTLEDAASCCSAGSFTAIPTASQTTITSTASSGTAITRYLGLLVSNANGAGAFPGTAGAGGSDSATVTYTMTVP